MRYPTLCSRRACSAAKPVPASAINTCPSLIFPSNVLVGIHPTCFVCSFCNESMNGISSIVAGRIVTFTLGTGSARAREDSERFFIAVFILYVCGLMKYRDLLKLLQDDG